MDFFAFASQNARSEFPTPQPVSDAEYYGYVFECDADLAQLAEAQRMRYAFKQAEAKAAKDGL